MSLSDPLWLLALLVIPLVLLAQRTWRGRARQYAVRFTAVPALLEAAGDARTRVLSLLPLALALIAVGVGIVGLSRPTVPYRVPVGRASVMLVLDHSGSMAATDVAPSRIQAAIKAGNTFIGELPVNVKLGFVGFGSTPDTVQAPTPNHAITRSLLDEQAANGGTDTGPALQLALKELDGSSKKHPPSAIVLESDGAANEGISPVTVAAQAKRDHIAIYTIALGTPEGYLNEGPIYGDVPVPPDPQLMDAIASTSGGKAFQAQNAGELGSIYRDLGDRLGSAERHRDIAVWWLIGAAALLLLAVAWSAWNAVRLP